MKAKLLEVLAILFGLAFAGLVSARQITVTTPSGSSYITDIGLGDKLVLKKEFLVPPNSQKIYLPGDPCCCLHVVSPSNRMRKIQAGKEFVFSGNAITENNKKECVFELQMKGGQFFSKITFWGGYEDLDGSFDGSLRKIRITKDGPLSMEALEKNLGGYFEFVPAEPEIVK